MKIKLKFHKILLFLVFITIFIGSLLVFNASRDLMFSYRWKSLITNLSSINNDINFLLETMLLNPNYDAIMELGEKFERDLNDILKASKGDILDPKNVEISDIERIKGIFTEKFDYVYTYNSIVSYSRVIYLNLLQGDKGKYFEDIMSQIILFKYDVNTNLSKVSEKINLNLATSDLNNEDQLFLTNARALVQYYVELQQILNKIRSLGLRVELNYIVSQNQSYINKSTETLNNIVVMFLVCLSLIFVFSLFAFLDTKKAIRTISYLSQALDNSFGSVVFINKNRSFIYANRNFIDNSNYIIKDIKNKKLELINLYPDLKSSYLDITKAISDDKIWQNTEFVNTAKSGDLAYENIKFAPLHNENGHKDGYMMIKLDRTKEIFAIKELEKRESEIERRAYIDNLTGLGNYYSLLRMLDTNHGGQVIYISINNFIDFRFFYKASTIELIVASFARSLKLCIDTYSIDACIYRVQFDEFYIWYRGNYLQRDLARIMEYINGDDLYIVVDNQREAISNIKTTIGISLPNDTPQTNRITQAMLAYHQAKESGDMVAYYKENFYIEEQYHKNQIISKMIEYALYNDTIIVECQGIFDVSNPNAIPHVHYYEILVRLIDETGKIRYPGEFLEIAKKISLYNDITKKVIEHTFRLVERFPETSFSVNLSSSDIENDGIREFLEQKLNTCSYPEHICFEMLESEGMKDYQLVNKFIDKMRSYKCKISIDDFGSGYSNYYRVLELDIDTIKIDGSLVKKLPTDKNARDLVNTIVEFANHQNYNIVAEFVSTEEILAEVRKFGIKYAQGFLLGKPISPDKI